MEFAFVTVFVRDMDTSLQFYSGLLGLGVNVRRPLGDGREMAMLGGENAPQIELISDGGTDAKAYAGFTLGIAVDDLDAAVAKLAAAGFPVVRGPISPGPHVRFSFVRDPDGIEIQLTQHL